MSACVYEVCAYKCTHVESMNVYTLVDMRSARNSIYACTCNCAFVYVCEKYKVYVHMCICVYVRIHIYVVCMQ